MFVIGLTGSLGTGKSTVARMFAKCGAKILDADVIARRQLYRGKKSSQRVVRIFGKDILTRGRIDRKKLAEIVFNDVKRLRELENIIHPEIRREIIQKLKQYKRAKKTIVMDVPLLFEAGLDVFADQTMVVKAKKNIQIERAMKHLGMTKTEVLKRIKAQMSLREKIRRADVVIDNSGNLIQIKKQVQKIWEKILK